MTTPLLDRLTTLGQICDTHELDLYAPLARRLASRTADPLTVVVLGKVSSGKSTLLNRLAGDTADAFLPVDARRVTARMTELVPGETQALFRVDREGEEHAIDLATFRALVRAQGDPALAEATTRLRAELPALKGFGGLRLVDAPGFESLTEADEEWVRDYLPEADAILYCAEAFTGLTSTDLARLRELSGDDPAVGGFSRIRVLLTKADHFDAPSNATKKLEEAKGLLVTLGMSPDQAQLCAFSPRKVLGLEPLTEWITGLRHSGAKAQRLRRQSQGLEQRVRQELSQRLETLVDPTRIAAAEQKHEQERAAIARAIAQLETQALAESKGCLPRASTLYGEGLAGFYAEEKAYVQGLGGVNDLRDYLVRHFARREGNAALQAAWQGALAEVSQPFRAVDLGVLGLPECSDLDKPLLANLPEWAYTALEWAADIGLFILTSGGSGAAQGGRQAAKQGAKAATKAAAKRGAKGFLGKAVKWLLKKAPILKPLLTDLKDLAADQIKANLLGQMDERRAGAAQEAQEALAEVPEHLLEAAQLAGSLRQDQDAALQALLEQAQADEQARLAAVAALRQSLATLDTLEA